MTLSTIKFKVIIDGYLQGGWHHALTEQPDMLKSLQIHRTLGHLSTVWPIFIWKTSWDIFKPKGICLKQYLPKSILNIVRRELLCEMYALESI